MAGWNPPYHIARRWKARNRERKKSGSRAPFSHHLSDDVVVSGSRGNRSAMNNYLLLAACLVLGMLLRRSGRLPANAAAALNGYVVYISLPALTLVYVHGLELRANLILPALMPWVLFAF